MVVMKFEEARALISSDETSWSIQCLLSSLLFLHLVHLSLLNNPPNYTIKALRILNHLPECGSVLCLVPIPCETFVFSRSWRTSHLPTETFSENPPVLVHSLTLTHGCTQSYSCCCWEKICRVFWGLQCWKGEKTAENCCTFIGLLFSS